jgi:hypothetical protein
MDFEETRSRFDLSERGQSPVADPYKHGNEISGSIKDGKFLDQLRDD